MGKGCCARAWSYNENAMFVYTRALIRQIKYKAIMTIKEGSAKIVNFITIGVLC